MKLERLVFATAPNFTKQTDIWQKMIRTNIRFYNSAIDRLFWPWLAGIIQPVKGLRQRRYAMLVPASCSVLVLAGFYDPQSPSVIISAHETVLGYKILRTKVFGARIDCVFLGGHMDERVLILDLQTLDRNLVLHHEERSGIILSG